MVKVGELVKWRNPLDEDYSYGTVLEVRKNIVIVQGSGYYKGTVSVVHLKHIRKVKRGGKGFGGSKKHHK